MNIPNILSIFRICLIPVFLTVFLTAQQQPAFLTAAVILVISGLTDALDGYIARKYNQITNLGKILDPLADKLTQVAVVFSLIYKFPEMWMFLAMFAIKEILIIAGSAKLLSRYREVASSRWFGKLYTVVFYIGMVIIIASPNLSKTVIISLLMIMFAFMVFSLFMYIPIFIKLNKKK